MGVSLKIITDVNSLLGIEEIWNKELNNSSTNPFLFSNLLSEFMKIERQEGWTPVVFSFWLNERLVGIVPLKSQKTFFSHKLSSLKDELYSDNFLCDEFRVVCLNLLLEFVLKKKKHKSVELTIQNGYSIIGIIMNFCKKNGYHFLNVPYNGRACIAIENDWDDYFNSFSRNSRKKFRRATKRINCLGDWRVSCFDVNSNSTKRILSIDNKSWKAKWRARKKKDRDFDLIAFLTAFKKEIELDSDFKPEVWFLEVNGQAIAYQLSLFFKGVAFFVKTSYDDSFKQFSPGNLLTLYAIRDMFKRKTVNTVDLITDLPSHRVFKPQIIEREKVYIQKNSQKLKIIRFIYRYPRIKKIFKTIFNILH